MALSTAITAAGTTLYYTTSLPATSDQAGYAALSGWVKVSEISNLGTFGGKSTIVKHIPIDTRTVVKRAGSVDYGTISMTLARHNAADVAGLQALFANQNSASFKIIFPTQLGVGDYFTAITASFQTSAGTADQILQSMVDLEIDSPIITF